MKRIGLFIALAALVVVVGAYAFFSLNADKGGCSDGVAAVVNGRAITELEFKKNLPMGAKAGGGMKEAPLRKKVLDELINAELLFQTAVRKYGEMERSQGIQAVLDPLLYSAGHGQDSLTAKEKRLYKYERYMKEVRKSADIVRCGR